MEQQLQKIDAFLQQQQCIFEFDRLDYPSLWQQQFINSYFYMKKLLQREHNQIIRQMHSANEKLLESIAQGFLYSSIYSAHLFEQFRGFMIVLRVEVWNLINKNFQILLEECVDKIKPQYLRNFTQIYTLVLYYSNPQLQITRLLLKCISHYQQKPDRRAYGKQLLLYFQQLILSQQVTKYQQLYQFLCHSLFIKCLRLLNFSEYNQAAYNIVQKLWEMNPTTCSQFSTDNIIVIESSRRIGDIQKIYKQLKKQAATQIQKYGYREMVYGNLLPKSIESILRFILGVENIEFSNIRYYLAWIENLWKENQITFNQLILDMAVWVTLNFNNCHRRVYILDWIICKSFYHNIEVYKMVRECIYERWFRQIQNQQYFTVSIMVLRHMIYNDARISNDLFTHILQPNQNQSNLKIIFKFANKKGLLKFDEINLSNSITIAIKEALRNLIGGYSNQQESEQEIIPEQNLLRHQSESAQEINYESPNVSIPTKITEESYILNISQEYAVKIDQELNNILDEPTFDNFKKYFKKVCEQGVAFRKSGENEQLGWFCMETAKVLYVMFNNQFEDYSVLQPKDQSIIFHLLNFILMEWHRVTHKLQIYKQVVKQLITHFPNSQPALWRYFFTYCEYGGMNNRSVKSWLIKDEKSRIVVPLLQQLIGKCEESMKKNMYKYGLKPI